MKYSEKKENNSTKYLIRFINWITCDKNKEKYKKKEFNSIYNIYTIKVN